MYIRFAAHFLRNKPLAFSGISRMVPTKSQKGTGCDGPEGGQLSVPTWSEPEESVELPATRRCPKSRHSDGYLKGSRQAKLLRKVPLPQPLHQPNTQQIQHDSLFCIANHSSHIQRDSWFLHPTHWSPPHGMESILCTRLRLHPFWGCISSTLPPPGSPQKRKTESLQEVGGKRNNPFQQPLHWIALQCTAWCKAGFLSFFPFLSSSSSTSRFLSLVQNPLWILFTLRWAPPGGPQSWWFLLSCRRSAGYLWCR